MMLQLDPTQDFKLIEQKVYTAVELILDLFMEHILIHFGARFLTTIVSVGLFIIISKPIHDLVSYTKSFNHNQRSLAVRFWL